MYVVILTYKTSLEMVDTYIIPHREFLAQAYKDGHLIMSGPQNPRTGGILIVRDMERTALEALLSQDPFWQEGIADYQIIAFAPNRWDPSVSALFP